MEQPAPMLNNDAILVRAAWQYGIPVVGLRPLLVDEGTHVYAYERGGKGFVLKWTSGAEKSAAALSAEVAWANYLADHGAPVCRILPSRQNKLVEVIATGDSDVYVVAQERAAGQRPAGDALNAALFGTWGEVMGRMHALAKGFRLVGVSAAIRSWYESEHLLRAHIPADQPRVLARYDALMEQLHALPRDHDTYGVVHGDFQANNCVVADGKLRVFDFDACERNWFVSDIAVALYFHLWEPHPGHDNHTFAAAFLDPLLAGYRRANTLDTCWLAQLPVFLKLQEMAVYIAINRYNRLADGGELATVPAKHRRLLQRYREHTEEDIPYLDTAYNPWQP